jgi:predicted Rossmann fold nucleotide-binding protein DprA/Smf involved in DNA uptake
VSRLPDGELAALLLSQRLVDVGAEPLKASEFWALTEWMPDPAVLLSCRVEDLRQIAEIDEQAAARLVERVGAATTFAFALEDAEATGLRMVSGLSPDYPIALRQRLGRSAPPVLYVLGDLDLLSSEGLGIVGSRAVSDSGATFAKGAAALVVAAGLTVFSGGAKGVDRLAMNAALDGDGQVVGVVADSLLRTGRDPEVRRAIADGGLCLCTPYKPSAGFTVANAMGRNKLIYALSQATLVVECEEGRGGTWAGAVEALRGGTAPVLSWVGPHASAGNRALVAHGATPVGHIEDLLPLPRFDESTTADQLVLGI